jgi:hypothetical protein
VVAATYDGSRASAGLRLYLNGTAVDDTNTSSGSYTAMKNLGAPVGPWYTSTSGNNAYRSQGSHAVTLLTAQELTAAEVLSLSRWLLGYAGQL